MNWKSILYTTFVSQHKKPLAEKRWFERELDALIDWPYALVDKLPERVRPLATRAVLYIEYLLLIVMLLAWASLVASFAIWQGTPGSWMLWFGVIFAIVCGGMLMLFLVGFLYTWHARRKQACILCGKPDLVECDMCGATYCQWCFERTHLHTVEERGNFRQAVNEYRKGVQ